MIKYDIILSKGGAMAGILNIQLNPVLSDKEKNLLSVNKYIEQFADKNLDLVVLPEFFSTGVHQESFVNSPEDTNGGIVVEALSETARKFNTNIVCGSVIERDGDNLYNTSFVLDRSGKIVGKYRKIHLFSFFGGNENSYTTPGNLPPLVVEMDFARVGVSICFDIKYPLLYKSLIKKGAEIIVSPSAWIKLTSLSDKQKQDAATCWKALNIARAAENLVYFVTSNLTGNLSPTLYSLGNSMIVNPMGVVESLQGQDEGADYKDIDLKLVRELKKTVPVAFID